MKEYYTIDEVATLSMLSTRTLRNYIKSGFLQGDKVNGVWQFTSEDLDTFLHHNYVKQSIQAKRNGIVFDFMSNDTKTESTVCSIYDYIIPNKQEAEIICTNLLALINTNQYGEIVFSYQFEEKKKSVRIIISGRIDKVTDLMRDYQLLSK